MIDADTPNQSRRNSDVRWWGKDPDEQDEVATSLSAWLKRLRDKCDFSLRAYEHAYRLYGNDPYGAMGGSIRLVPFRPSSRLSWNVVASTIDTVHAEVVSSRPRAMFLTQGGDPALKARIEKLTKFCDAAFDHADVDTIGSAVCLDALTYGIGAGKVFSEWGKLKCMRVLPWELWADPDDGRNGKPRAMAHATWFDRYVLAELYAGKDDKDGDDDGERREESDDGENEGAADVKNRTLSKAERAELRDRILAAPHNSGWGVSPTEVPELEDLLLVVEAWHLPSGPGADDGRHVVSVYGTRIVLIDEPYEEESFPIVVLRWRPNGQGWHSQGIADQLSGIQLDINYNLESIQVAHYLLANARIFIQGNSEIILDHLTNEIGGVVRCMGPIPVCQAWEPVSPSQYQWVNTQKQQAFAEIGVSLMSAQSLKPAGIDSGVALRTYLDTQSKRFRAFATAYAKWHVGIAEQMMREMVRLAAENPEYDVIYKGKGAIERLKYSEVVKDIDEGSYSVDTFPVSAFPNDPAARLQQMMELKDRGIIDDEAFLELSEFPDMDSQLRRLMAPRKLVEKLLAKIQETGEYVYPDPMIDLRMGLKLGGLAVQQAMLDDVDDATVRLLRQWCEDCQAEIAKEPPAPPPMPNAAPGAPQPMPAAAE